MDVISIERSTIHPGVPRGPHEPVLAVSMRRPLDELARHARRLLDRTLRLLGTGGPGGVSTVRHNLLTTYTAAEIILGFGLLAWVTVAVPVRPDIAPGLDGTALAGPVGGLLLWVAFGFLGSFRAFPSPGTGSYFTYHLPFVGAAMVLGGPTAGAWVALLATIERREIMSVSWYGVLANHAAWIIAAVVGALTFTTVDALLLELTGEPGPSTFVAIVAGAIVLAVTDAALATGTIMLRDDLRPRTLIAMLIEEFGRDSIVQIALVWILVMAYISVAWWAPLVIGVVVIAFSRTPHAEPPDPLTGLPLQKETERQVARRVDWMRRGILDGGTVMLVNLVALRDVRDRIGAQAADEVLVEVGQRLARSMRRGDLVGRHADGWFMLAFSNLVSHDVATAKAQSITELLARPISTSGGMASVAAAVGVVVVPEGESPDAIPSASTLLRRAEQAALLVTRTGGPAGLVHHWSPRDPLVLGGGDGTPREV
jgi:diguanylate cyclase (GGDEF)-like protein